MGEFFELYIKSPACAPDEKFRVAKCSDDLVTDKNRELYDCINYTLLDVEEFNANNALLNGFAAVTWTSWLSISSYCKFYNSCVDEFCKEWKSSGIIPKFCQRQARFHQLKYIMALCYNRAIEDPDRLNQYPPFSPQVYGETSFELVQQMVDSISINDEDTFIDLGSGVGQVVLQIAASTNVKFSYGIEKADYPAQCAICMDREFKRWMAFFGKTYRPYKLVQGDFLADDYANIIETSTVVFANNFAFGPEVDYHLTLRFSRLCEGARIISSKSFCARSIRMSDRRLGDLSSIIKLTLLDPVNEGVSWTDKPFRYYLHTIDRSLLLKYFSDLKEGQQDQRTKKRKSGNSTSNAAANTASNYSDGSQGSSSASSVCDTEQNPASQSQSLSKSKSWPKPRCRQRRKTRRLSAIVDNAEQDSYNDESIIHPAQPVPLTSTLHQPEENDSNCDTACLTPQSSQCASQSSSDRSTSTSAPPSCSPSDSASADSDFKIKLASTEDLLISSSSSRALNEVVLGEGSPRHHKPLAPAALRRHFKLTKRMFLKRILRNPHPTFDGILRKEERQNQLLEHIRNLEETIKSMHEEGKLLITNFTSKLETMTTTPTTFFFEARKIIRHNRKLEVKMVELRMELVLLANIQRQLLRYQMATVTQLKHKKFKPEDEPYTDENDRPSASKRRRCPPQLFPETETAAITPPILLPAPDGHSIAPPRLTPILRDHSEGTSPPSSRVYDICDSCEGLSHLSRRRSNSLDAIKMEEFPAGLG